ncbi:hypothetical protein CZ787_03240 [Halomonas citrativorans]|uniref:Uncharacterized protein n=1 Tax=Halomonas citrativorans TaxID=2742612 RepID=A0A1R4HRR9_9GAMM|nr:hypothetical protein CZ787_03240 [Halomonas citrativorans]
MVDHNDLPFMQMHCCWDQASGSGADQIPKLKLSVDHKAYLWSTMIML